jgi:hypothetical protein
LPQQGAPAPSSQSMLFQSNDDNIRVELPVGWVVDDRFNGTDPLTEQVVRQHRGEEGGHIKIISISELLE